MTLLYLFMVCNSHSLLAVNTISKINHILLLSFERCKPKTKGKCPQWQIQQCICMAECTTHRSVMSWWVRTGRRKRERERSALHYTDSNGITTSLTNHIYCNIVFLVRFCWETWPFPIVSHVHIQGRGKQWASVVFWSCQLHRFA